jgi:hypothetical protein
VRYAQGFLSWIVGLRGSIFEVEDLVYLQKRFGLSYCSWSSLWTVVATIVGGDPPRLRGGRWTVSGTRAVPTISE